MGSSCQSQESSLPLAPSRLLGLLQVKDRSNLTSLGQGQECFPNSATPAHLSDSPDLTPLLTMPQLILLSEVGLQAGIAGRARCTTTTPP